MNKEKSIFSYYKPYKGLFFGDMLCALIMAGTSLTYPLIIRYITGQVLGHETMEQSVKIICGLAVLMVGLILVDFACNYFVTAKGHDMGARMERDMRNELFAHYQKLSFGFFDEQKTGQLMSRITNDLFNITELLHHGPEDVLISLVKIIGAFVILLNINVSLTLIIFAFLPVMFVVAMVFNKIMKKAFAANRARLADINSGIEDNLSGIRVVKSFANEAMEIEKFKENNGCYLSSKQRTYRYMAGYHSSLNAFTTLISVVVIVAGTLFMNQGRVALADLLAYTLYINNLIEPIKKLINFTEQFQEGTTGYERFKEMMDIQPEIVDGPEAENVTEAAGNIEFEDVSFRYQDGTEDVLTHIDLSVQAGDYVALVGPSGVGKTTLCNLIPRFYEVSTGAVKLDGKDIRNITLKSLRDHIGMVQQDVYLFAGTVMDNIRYGRPTATDQDVIEAAKNANAHEFIMNLPDGYHTDIGQRGVKLSGGQKQRLSIARVFLKNPPILIFDEATSALDNESERVVQESLERLAKHRTTFVIAHRLSTIKNARRILLLADSGIAEEGTHEELLAKGGLYADLYQLQFKH